MNTVVKDTPPATRRSFPRMLSLPSGVPRGGAGGSRSGPPPQGSHPLTPGEAPLEGHRDGLFQYCSGTWNGSWNRYGKYGIRHGGAQIWATAYAIKRGWGPQMQPVAYRMAFGS